jgi:hypothetical protein
MLPSTSRVTSSLRSLGKEEKRKELNAEVETGKSVGVEIEMIAEVEIGMIAEVEIEEIVEVEIAEITIVMTGRREPPEEITVKTEVVKEEEVEIETND